MNTAFPRGIVHCRVPEGFFTRGRRFHGSLPGLIAAVAALLISATSAAQSNYATPYTFTTFAGAAGAVGSADGTGIQARFNEPGAAAVDAAGNVYVADTFNNVIRKITPAGVVTTLAGRASPNGGSADGTGAAAHFYNPEGVAVDGSGNVYVGDTANYTIRRITQAGVVTTLAGTAGVYGTLDGAGGAAQFVGPGSMAADAAGNIYVADGDRIRKVTPAGVVSTLAGSGAPGGADGTGSAAEFNGPSGVAVDGLGYIYVADSGNGEIRIVSPAGAVSTMAGAGNGSGSEDGTMNVGSETGTARFSFPHGVAVDGAGNIYVADGTAVIREIVPLTLQVTTLAGLAGQIGSADGTGPSALFDLPNAVVVDGSGNLYVVDLTNGNLRRGGGSAGIPQPPAIETAPVPETVTEGNAACFTLLATVNPVETYQWEVSADNGSTFAPLTDNGVSYGSGPGISGSATSTLNLTDTTVGMSGNEYECIVTNSMGSTTTIPVTLTVNSSIAIPSPFAFRTLAGPAAGVTQPGGIAVDGAGNVTVANTAMDTILRINTSGAVNTIAGTSGTQGSADGTGGGALFALPRGVAVDAAGNVYVADSGNDTIRLITPALAVTTIAGTAGQVGSADGAGAAAQFDNPGGIAVDGSGNVYVSDTGNGTIRMIVPAVSGGSTTWTVTTLAGSPGPGGALDGIGAAALFSSPEGVAVDGAGNLYVADTGNSSIRKITPTVAGAGTAWTVTTLAGTMGADPNDQNGSSGAGSSDGSGAAGYGEPNSAQFSSPDGVAVDGAGNVYVVDTGNGTVRLIAPGGSVTTLAGNPGYFGSNDGTGTAVRFDEAQGIAVNGSGNVFVADTLSSAIRQGSLASGPPIDLQPASQAVNEGSNIVLAVGVSSSLTLTYQWYFNGNPISGAKLPTLSLNDVQPPNAGTYTVGITDSTGARTISNGATLSVNAVVSGGISGQPSSQSIAPGGTVVFTVTVGTSQAPTLARPDSQSASLSSPTTYQWQFNGANLADGNGISGSTGPQLVITAATSGDDGDYTCLVTTGGVTVQSSTAGLVVAPVKAPGFLVNISSRAFVGTGANILIGGFYIGGSSSRSVLIQALGPALSDEGVPGALEQPTLSIYNSKGAAIYSNTGWGSSPVLLKAAASAYASPVLKQYSGDSEVLLTLPPGGYTAQVSGVGNETGVALCAIYQLP